MNFSSNAACGGRRSGDSQKNLMKELKSNIKEFESILKTLIDESNGVILDQKLEDINYYYSRFKNSLEAYAFYVDNPF